MTDIFIDLFDNYESIDEFKESVIYGCEVEFKYHNRLYGITRLAVDNINLYSPKENGFEEIDILLPSIDDLLDYEVDGVKIKEAIFDAEITWRNL